MKLLWVLLLISFPVFAQNVTPQPESGLLELIEVDIRLTGVPTATNQNPTVKLFSAQKFVNAEKKPDYMAKEFTFAEACWNKSSNCPPVVGLTAQVFIKTPIGRLNVTRFTGMCGWTATTCVLPPFPALTAKPGEVYRFRYNRITAQWAVPPEIVVPLAPPPPTGTSPNGTKIPPAVEIVDSEGAKWTPLTQTGGTTEQIGAARNGVRVSNSIDFLWITDGVVFNQDKLSGSGCQRWSGAWVTTPCP